MKPMSMRLWWLVAQVATVAAVTLPAASGAGAQPFPSGEIHLICGFPAGGGADAIARFYAEKIKIISGRTVIVENKPGAGANISIEHVARAKPDGRTILMHGGPGLAASMHVFKKPPVDSVNALQIVATTNLQALMLAVDANKPWKTIAELTAAMRSKGEKATYATSAPTTTVMGAIYKKAAGLQAVEVNYRTSTDAYNDMLAGAIDYGVLEPVSTMAAHRQGKLRILALSTGQRLAAAPDFPTMIEAGIPLNMSLWWAAMVPAKTPRHLVEQLNRWFDQITATAEAKKFLNSFASDPYMLSPEGAQALLNKEANDWADYVRIAKIDPQG